MPIFPTLHNPQKYLGIRNKGFFPKKQSLGFQIILFMYLLKASSISFVTNTASGCGEGD